MANRYSTPVMFAMEKNVTMVYARIVFDAGGVAAIDTTSSKGICAFNPESIIFTAATTNSSTSVGTVSNFAGLYSGMTVTGSTGSLQAATTISSTNQTGLTLSLNKQAILTGASNTLTASGGRFRVQFGFNSPSNLDTYNKLLFFGYEWRETTSSSTGTAVQVALAPQCPDVFIQNNNTSVKTVPPTITTNSTDASLAIVTGWGYGPSFQAANPQPGEVLHLQFVFKNSTAV